MTATRIDISVVVATYRRVPRLADCLRALQAQQRPPDEVIVVVNSRDDDTARFISDLGRTPYTLRTVVTHRNGTVTAYNAGLEASSCAIVAYVDDDAVPTHDWLARIESAFASDVRVAAVGGRDIISPAPAQPGPVARMAGLRRQFDVGRIQPFGRMVANHHLGTGDARDVDVLKGVNMSFRREAVADVGFDHRLWGEGAQVHSELSICLPLRRRGLRVIYDPDIVVMHYPAPRLAGAERNDQSWRATADAAHNEALAIIDYFGPARAVIFTSWAMVIGHTDAPGLAVLVRDVIARKPRAPRRFAAAQMGRFAAWRTSRLPRSGPIVVAGSPAGDTGQLLVGR